jgi:triosephosphate isomerase
MKKIIIANHKMNPLTLSESIRLSVAEDFPGLYIAPPSIFLSEVKKNIKNAELVAQDVGISEFAVGAFTGDISVLMLKKIGVKMVLVGHSERRAGGETEIQISKKIKTVLSAGLKVVLCVGEPLVIRQKGLPAVKKFLEKQINSAISEVRNMKEIRNLLIAYEPIWAIGSGKFASPEDVVGVVSFIKSIVSSKVLYGGSVSVENSGGFLSKPEIDGLLVGGLSLKPKEFKKIFS